MKIGVSVYVVGVRNDKNQQYEIHDIDGKDLIAIINNHAKVDIGKYDNDKADEKMFSFSRLEYRDVKTEDGKEKYEVLFFSVKTGDYGVASEIVDSETLEITYHKKSSEAEMMTFSGCIIAPRGKHTTAVILMQTLGRYGFVTTMKKHINLYIKAENDNNRVYFDPLMPREFAEKILNEGKLSGITFIRYRIPSDIADQLGVNSGATEVREERRFKARGGFPKEIIHGLLFGNKDKSAVVSIENFDVDDIQFIIKNGSSEKTITLSNIDKLQVHEDITEKIGDAVEADGSPKFEPLCKILREIGEWYLSIKGVIM